jgi:hypothetical protein
MHASKGCNEQRKIWKLNELKYKKKKNSPFEISKPLLSRLNFFNSDQFQATPDALTYSTVFLRSLTIIIPVNLKKNCSLRIMCITLQNKIMPIPVHSQHRIR